MQAKLACVLIATAIASAGEGRWKLRFFHDEDRSQFVIVDIAFCSARQGIAIGTVVRDRGKPKPMSVVTRDGGRTWTYRELKERPYSVFFVNETHGWMVTEGGIWASDEGGLSWRKISSPDNVQRVFFVDETRGWAVGTHKAVLSTDDGGKAWTAVPAAAKPNTTPEHTIYNWVDFINPRVGIITGHSGRPAPSELDIEKLEQRPERPSLTIFLETRDGGQTWAPQTTSIFGRVTRVRMQRHSTRALGLIEFENAFRWPSEVLSIDLGSGSSKRVLAERNLATTDLAITADGIAYAFGYEPGGAIARSPIPGRVRVLESRDLEKWTDMDVDYRAVANRVLGAVSDTGHVWIACDSGMLLELTSE